LQKSPWLWSGGFFVVTGCRKNKAMIGFIDESTNRRYRLCLVVCSENQLRENKKALTPLLLPGQTRIHMTKENQQRRGVILKSIQKLEFSAYVFEIDDLGLKPNVARSILIRAIGGHFSWISIDKLILDKSTSEVLDARIFLDLFQSTGHRLHFQHQSSSGTPGLWITDALLWAYSKGGAWRAQAMKSLTIYRVH
jgi:hypothetical protein